MNRDDEIFAGAIELPAAERAGFLDRACGGDSALRARIDALLAAHEVVQDFLDRSPAVRPNLPAEEKAGDVIGRYTLVRKIGEGGCGVVYLAEQTEPVRRQVALKIIKLGMDTHAVIARFEAERQTLAMMDHPDIARVFDAGATETGRPYFVMEFVDGVPITKFCDEHHVPMTARLELFSRVCLAMQHAHQKGIIHRDVKPSNILVALHDGVPSPKVIDFGIAKATQGRLAEHTLLTDLGQFIGTPAYMSPEQAERRDLDIDTRSDVYSLGVLLYELLTGRPPFDPGTLLQAGVDEIRRIIREVDPPRPSTRISTLTDADRSTVARLRGAGPMQLSSTLRGDLDWIVMRCLEKDRNRRYDTAHELADDVRRHLRQEPVAARPPSRLYRAEKFIARNRLACASAAAVAAALIIGTVVSARQAIRATRAEHVARTERDTAHLAQRAEALARADAQRRQEQAEDLLTFMLGDFRTELEKIGRLNLLDAVGAKAAAYFAALDPRDLTDAALARQSRALTQIGEVRLDEARYPEAADAFSNAYVRAAALVDRHPRDGDMLFERAQAEFWIGFVARRRGDFETQREWLVRYRDSTVALVALEGKKLRAQLELTAGHHNLAVLDHDRGNFTAARTGFLAEQAALEELLAANPSDLELRSRLATAAAYLGFVTERDGNLPEALAHFTAMSSRVEELVARDPATVEWRLNLVESRSFIANVQALLGRRDEASAGYARAREQIDQLTAQDPKNQRWQIAALTIRLQQASLRLAAADPSSGAPLLEETRGKLDALVAAEPSSQVFRRLLATAWRLEGRIRLATHQADAAAAAEHSLALSETLIKEGRADVWAFAEFAQAAILAGRLARAEGHADAAQRDWTQAVDALVSRIADSNDWRLLDPAAQAYTLLGKTAEARPLLERLRRSGYHPFDPLAASTLGLATSAIGPATYP